MQTGVDKRAGEIDVDRTSREAAAWFFETSVDVFLVTERGVILRMNPAWTSLTGWQAEETLGQTLSAFSHPDDGDAIAELRVQLDTTGQALAEHRIRAVDGRWLWVRARPKRDSNGSAVVVLQDITEERRRAEEADEARRSRELLREAAGIYMWRYDPAADSYSFDPESGLGVVRSAARVLRGTHPDDMAILDAAWLQTLATGDYAVVEYRRRAGTGPYARYRTSWRGTGLTASGSWEIIGVTQDITELADARDAAVQGEQAAQAAAATKAEFLANMSHEIRTPLNGVLGVLHLLSDEPLSEEGRDFLKEALACGAMLGALLNDVIDFSKIEEGRLELTPEAIDPGAALQGVANLLRSQAEAKGLWLRTDIAPGVGWVSVDPVRLRQTLFNLIGNAVKFTIEGGVTAKLSLSGKGAGQRLIVAVTDTGIGIAPEAQAHMFERFHQADGSTTRRFGGSGLGLTITRSLAEIMDGEIRVTSATGQGSTFTIEIAAPETAAPTTDETADAPLAGVRTLVVEDNPTNRLIVSKMLANLGASVTLAENGLEGVEAAQRSEFDLIFMDVQMPVMDGITATRTIRAMPGPASSTPIIAMTANALAHQQAEYRAAGMNGSVSKPISPLALFSEMARILNDPDATDDALTG